nr:mitogen-activated protein kinase kinase 5-like [Ipomoea trifida]
MLFVSQISLNSSPEYLIAPEMITTMMEIKVTDLKLICMEGYEELLLYLQPLTLQVIDSLISMDSSIPTPATSENSSSAAAIFPTPPPNYPINISELKWTYPDSIAIAVLSTVYKAFHPPSGNEQLCFEDPGTWAWTRGWMMMMRKVIPVPNWFSSIWSLGLTIWELYVGEYPLGERLKGNLRAVNKAISEWESRSPVMLMPYTTSPELRNFIGGCLEIDPEKRLTVRDLFGHPFISRCPLI